MAEVVGLAASILQIAGAGVKLSTALYNFASSASRADRDVADIADDVMLTANALDSVGKVFEKEDGKTVVSRRAIQDANGLIKRCDAVFGEIQEVVEKRRKVCKDGKKILSTFGKFSWPLKEQRIELLRRRLESLKNSLMLLLHVLQLANGQAKGELEKSALEQEREKIRELHQRQQYSLQALQALESKLSKVSLEDEETLRGSNAPSRVPTIDFMVRSSTSVAPEEANQSGAANSGPTAMATPLSDDSGTSDSDDTVTDDEGEHLTVEELTKCANHVQKLLKRITVLQQSFEAATAQSTGHYPKHRVSKLYRRFCRKFESEIVLRKAADAAATAPLQEFVPPSKAWSGMRGESERTEKMLPSIRSFTQADFYAKSPPLFSPLGPVTLNSQPVREGEPASRIKSDGRAQGNARSHSAQLAPSDEGTANRDPSVFTFNPAKSLHIRTNSDSPRQSNVPRSSGSFSRFGEIQFPIQWPRSSLSNGWQDPTRPSIQTNEHEQKNSSIPMLQARTPTTDIGVKPESGSALERPSHATSESPPSLEGTEEDNQSGSEMNGDQTPVEGMPIHYTKTGRISKAKKGLKVHTCQCGKSFTRAEHLRRHQKNHGPNQVRCDLCGKVFFRVDLLQRHRDRHKDNACAISPATPIHEDIAAGTGMDAVGRRIKPILPTPTYSSSSSLPPPRRSPDIPLPQSYPPAPLQAQEHDEHGRPIYRHSASLCYTPYELLPQQSAYYQHPSVQQQQQPTPNDSLLQSHQQGPQMKHPHQPHPHSARMAGSPKSRMPQMPLQRPPSGIGPSLPSPSGYSPGFSYPHPTRVQPRIQHSSSVQQVTTSDSRNRATKQDQSLQPSHTRPRLSLDVPSNSPHASPQLASNYGRQTQRPPSDRLPHLAPRPPIGEISKMQMVGGMAGSATQSGPFQQTVQDTHAHPSSFGRDPHIKSEFGRMFSGLGSSLGTSAPSSDTLLAESAKETVSSSSREKDWTNGRSPAGTRPPPGITMEPLVGSGSRFNNEERTPSMSGPFSNHMDQLEQEYDPHENLGDTPRPPVTRPHTKEQNAVTVETDVGNAREGGTEEAREREEGAPLPRQERIITERPRSLSPMPMPPSISDEKSDFSKEFELHDDRSLDLDLGQDEGIESASPQYKCLYPPCTYASARQSNCKQHMEKAHGWEYAHRDRTPPTPLAPFLGTPQSATLPTSMTPFLPSPSVPMVEAFDYPHAPGTRTVDDSNDPQVRLKRARNTTAAILSRRRRASGSNEALEKPISEQEAQTKELEDVREPSVESPAVRAGAAARSDSVTVPSPSSRRKSPHARHGGKNDEKWEPAAKGALVAGAVEAFRSRNIPSPWTGEKGQRIATAALGAAGIDSLVDKNREKHGKRTERGPTEVALDTARSFLSSLRAGKAKYPGTSPALDRGIAEQEARVKELEETIGKKREAGGSAEDLEADKWGDGGRGEEAASAELGGNADMLGRKRKRAMRESKSDVEEESRKKPRRGAQDRVGEVTKERRSLDGDGGAEAMDVEEGEAHREPGKEDDDGERDIVDVLLEQWTIPVY
ncbi:hypothetical protein BU26DRAFT_516804 [Trematosphaeria pertusa]|uniref:C2H2-type domain-containing protein n=1 Tax=Trematosphaeria pertusa TaxID=390896 RepID=A0A6A6IPW4_9PLEO|nr:uncharacterized protein BU26DRAFT_516804 [Trematosphaeria pertusa]KAF2252108.1 hypothetical protein BU26DRAFT_516804 [Trematosphaeria pertusa]